LHDEVPDEVHQQQQLMALSCKQVDMLIQARALPEGSFLRSNKKQ